LSGFGIEFVRLGLRRVLSFVRGIDGAEDGRNHARVGEAKLDNHVNTARTNESLVQLLEVVGGHDEDATLLRGHTIEDVEETREGESTGEERDSGALSRDNRSDRGCDSFLCGALLALFTSVGKTGGIDILKQDNASSRKISEKRRQVLLICHGGTQADHVDAHSEKASQGETERTLSSTGRAIEEITTAVGNTTVRVPATSAWVEVVGNVVKEVLLYLLVEDDGGNGTAGTGHAALPGRITAVAARGTAVDQSLALVLLQVLRTGIDEELLEDAGVAAEARDGDFLTLAHDKEARLLAVLVTLEKQKLTLIPEEVGAK
jgi:hypothetical protein